MGIFIKNKESKKTLTMALVILFIFSDILCANFMGMVYGNQSEIAQLFFFFGFIALQIIFAPFQSGISDRIGRRRSLIFSISVSFFSLFLFLFYKSEHVFGLLLIIATFLKGSFGNTLPVSLALMADIQNKGYRTSFAFSTGAYALAYLLLAGIMNEISQGILNYGLLFLFFILIIICVFVLNDPEDNDEEVKQRINRKEIIRSMKKEIWFLYEDLKKTELKKALWAFFFWEISLYSILLTQIDFHINQVTHIAQSMMYGYLIGVLILLLMKKFRDSNTISVGYVISFVSLVPYFILFKFIPNEIGLIKTCYFFHALGNAFLSPSLLSILANERKPHERGRTYGLTDSVDTCGYLGATLFIMLYKALNLAEIYLIIFSFLTFSISWKFYGRFNGAKLKT